MRRRLLLGLCLFASSIAKAEAPPVYDCLGYVCLNDQNNKFGLYSFYSEIITIGDRPWSRLIQVCAGHIILIEIIAVSKLGESSDLAKSGLSFNIEKEAVKTYNSEELMWTAHGEIESAAYTTTENSGWMLDPHISNITDTWVYSYSKNKNGILGNRTISKIYLKIDGIRVLGLRTSHPNWSTLCAKKYEGGF